MRAVVQRVREARVEVDGVTVGAIGPGILVLLGVARGDTPADAAYLAEKTAVMRIFEDSAGKMNLALNDVSGAVLVVSQFTLLGDCRNGRRPGFTDAAPPEQADALYTEYAAALRGRGLHVATGTFRAEMLVHLVNDGPVTLLLDSHKTF